jgi:Coenzyme PQQ synthesis protein D (PqqD)
MDQKLQLDESTMSWQDTDDGIVVLNLATSRYLVVNDSGRFLWERLLAGATARQLSEQLVEQYAIEPGQAEADVDDFVAELEATGLLATC